MADQLLQALVQHALDNCPACAGAGEIIVSATLGYDKIKYATCYRCKNLRAALKFENDPA